MKMELPPELYRALPLQVIELDEGLVLKRGISEFKVSGEGAVRAVSAVLAAASGEPASIDAIVSQFGEAERPHARALIDHLIRRRLLIPADAEAPAPRAETVEDVFYWQIGRERAEVRARLEDPRIFVVGVNGLARRLIASLEALGLRAIESGDDPVLRDPDLFDGRGEPREWPGAPPELVRGDAGSLDPERFDCLVVAAECGGFELMRPWNEFCVLHRRPMLPVVLQDMLGYVGPLVVPGETACYECFRQRLQTSASDPGSRAAIERAAGGRVYGLVPPMTAILAELASVELLRFFGLGAPFLRVGTVVEVNVLAPDVTARRVLKQPRCPVCTPVKERPALSIARAGGPG